MRLKATSHHLRLDLTGLAACTRHWAGQPEWRVLDTDLGDGSGLLHLWAAWLEDAQRPRTLHHVVLCRPTSPELPAYALPQADALLAHIAQQATLAALRPHAAALRAVWQGLLPGVHRLSLFDAPVAGAPSQGGGVELTLCVADPSRTPDLPPPAYLPRALRELAFKADVVALSHLSASCLGLPRSAAGGLAEALGHAGDEAPLHLLKALSALCRPGTRLCLPALAPAQQQPWQAALTQSGFDGLPTSPAPEGIWQLSYNPRWTPRASATALPPAVTQAGQCVVIGGGLAGASCAYSLAQRGWQVTVLDQGAEPAAGASGLPVGLVAPHVSADDRALSRLSRSGVRTTLRRAQTLLQAGLDWQLSGVLEHRVKDSRDLPPDWLVPDSPGQHWSRPASAAELNAAGLAADCPAHWHAQAGWVRPAALVRAMLAQVGITWCGQRRVARLLRSTAGWHLLDGQGQELAQAELVVLAAGYDTLALLQELEPAAQASSPQALPLNPLRGQITWGLMPPDADTTAPLPPFPVNGLGSFISGLATPEGRAWYVGSSFERGCALAVVRPQDNLSNLEKLQTLLPLTAARLQAQGQTQHLRSWTAVRCTVPDRVPVVGPWDVARHPGLWLCTAMGARGLTLATLCGELLAAQLHGEPLPLPLKQVRALAPQRWQNGAS